MDTKEECKANQMRIQQVISLLRNNPAVYGSDCNLLENDVNSLLAAIRKVRGWSTADLPNVCTLAEAPPGWTRCH